MNMIVEIEKVERLRICSEFYKQDVAVDEERGACGFAAYATKRMEWMGDIWRHTLEIKINSFGVF